VTNDTGHLGAEVRCEPSVSDDFKDAVVTGTVLEVNIRLGDGTCAAATFGTAQG
jgi:hypothetical protein